MSGRGRNVSLSPPWITLQRKFANTFGCDPAVTVGDLSDTSQSIMVLPIIVDDEKKGRALRTIIRQNFPMGNILVTTEVKNGKGKCWAAIIIENEKQLQDVITDAMAGNPLFVEAKLGAVPPFPRVGFIMTKTVVQFWNDDLSDFYGNFNGVTAEVVSDLINIVFGNNGSVQILMGTQQGH